jgi:hypothetical protein
MKPWTLESRILNVLDIESGEDIFTIKVVTGLSYRQISHALQRLRVKGLVRTARWRETSLWWRNEPVESGQAGL